MVRRIGQTPFVRPFITLVLSLGLLFTMTPSAQAAYGVLQCLNNSALTYNLGSGQRLTEGSDARLYRVKRTDTGQQLTTIVGWWQTSGGTSVYYDNHTYYIEYTGRWSNPTP
ncbi:hypothetical protein E4P41_03845 [Geodermatophilus sp. DF01-2]|uniref:hypothetical protein n=1 Tax=Geodermatophilus sp. DF01-2 TaxID=2559610 RepID=UPI001074241E|nr:hypothetical protein [Geodermatophilus sp. DF01_2]TFV63625.1 hypothetical protein E4P41_03845 [Geodermatophilus sp. DF01_2]